MLTLIRRFAAYATPARVAAATCSAAVLLTTGVAWAAGIH